MDAQDLVRIQDDGSTILLVDSDKLLGHLNNFILRETSIESKFTSVEVVRTSDDYGSDDYVLVAKGERYRTAWGLTLSDAGEGIFKATGLSYTEDCTADGRCMPDKSNSTCVTDCKSGACSRTVSVDTNILAY